MLALEKSSSGTVLLVEYAYVICIICILRARRVLLLCRVVVEYVVVSIICILARVLIPPYE